MVQSMFACAATAGGTIRLAYTTVDNGGHPQNSIVDGAGMLFLQGVDQNQPTHPTLFVDHVTLAVDGCDRPICLRAFGRTNLEPADSVFLEVDPKDVLILPQDDE